MSSILNIGVSALTASQRQLGTTGHNIANVNTEGYSRQRVEQLQRNPQFTGAGFIGQGVEVSTIERLASDFLTTQLRGAITNEAESSAFQVLSSQIDNLLGDGTFTQALRDFSNATQDVADDPASIPARAVLLDQAESLAARFSDLNTNLTAVAENVNGEINGAIKEINTIAGSIADLNKSIIRALGASQGQPPNDLLDRRDTLIRDLSRITQVSTNEQRDGAVNVFIGNGLTLVQSGEAIPLSTFPKTLDGTQLEVGYEVGGTISPITDSLAGGELGGVLKFRDSLVEPARNEIGRIAATIAQTFNEQHKQGLDLNGNLGGEFFSLIAPQVNANPANTGSISVVLDVNNIGNLTASDYRLEHDGSDFTLTDLQNNTTQTLSGAGPFNIDGLVITTTGAPAAGDSYILQPTKGLSRNIGILVRDPNELALALPVRAETALTNLSDANIEVDRVLDASDPQLLASTQFIFNDPPTTYQVDGAGPLIAYTSGADIDINGIRLRITGAPEAGDVFTLSKNSSGAGDNGNALLLNDVLQSKTIDGGNASLQDAFGQLVSSVGSATQQARVSQDALATLRENAEAARNSLSAVNLDEEAANLIRYQQSYQAAAELISTGNQLFQSLLNAVRN